jgi:hypothetical protein
MAASTGNQNNQRKNHKNTRNLFHSYTPRATEKTVLYEVIANYLETFLAFTKTPTHIEQEFRNFLYRVIFILF